MVTVVIPNYNHAKYLEQRINSIIDQTYQNFEIIILDDCSKDNSKIVIERYRHHPKVKHIIYNVQNSGSVFKQWKKGIELAEGNFIWIAESDDYAHLSFLEEMVPLLEGNYQVGFAFCDAFVVNEKGEKLNKTFAELRNSWRNTTKWSSSYYSKGQKEIEEALLEGCSVNNASGVLFRKQALLEVEPFDRNFKYIGDWYCYLKLSLKFDVIYLHNQLNYYREHEVNASKDLRKNLTYIQEFFLLFDWIFKKIDFVKPARIEKYFIDYNNHSIFKNINYNKLRLYKELLKINPKLFMLLIYKLFINSILFRFEK